MRQRILVVANDAEMRGMLARWLMAAGYAVELAEGAKRAREVVVTEKPALAIVAPAGLGEAGLEITKELGQSIGRLIVVTETGSGDAGAALALQAELVSKPLSRDEVLARVKALLPSQNLIDDDPEAPEVVRFAGFTIDPAGRTCIDANQNSVALTRAEFSLLWALARQAGRVVSRDALRNAVAGRGNEPDDRSVDVLISRVRRKIEAEPRQPRIIVTVPGEGYRLTADAQAVVPPATGGTAAAGGSAATTAEITAPLVADTGAPPASMPVVRATVSRRWALIASAALPLGGVAVWALLFWLPGLATKSASPTSGSATKFDPTIVPLLTDATRATLGQYAASPGHKALALSADAWGTALGAADVESAKREALERCSASGRYDKVCRLYAVDMDVVWTRASLLMPLPVDLHAEPLDIPFGPDSIPVFDAETRRGIADGYAKAIANDMKVGRHTAFAATTRAEPWAVWGLQSRAEVIRVTLERCSYYLQSPCLPVSVDGYLTIRVPTSRRVTRLFMVTTETEMSASDKEQIGRIYQQQDWRALARGGSGGWYPVANAPSESAAIEGATALCAQRDSECRLYAISNFRVADAP